MKTIYTKTQYHGWLKWLGASGRQQALSDVQAIYVVTLQVLWNMCGISISVSLYQNNLKDKHINVYFLAFLRVAVLRVGGDCSSCSSTKSASVAVSWRRVRV